MKKKLAVLLALVLVAVFSVSLAENTDRLSQIKDRGYITIATEGDWAPYTYHDESNALVGYDVEIGQAIAEYLGVEARFNEAPCDSILAGVEAGRFDIACNGVSYTPERAEKVDFALPYMNVALGVVSPDSRVIKDLSEITEGDQVIVISGTTAEDYLIKNNPEIALQKYDTYANAKNALENGNAVAWANDNTEVIAFALENPGYTVGIPSLGSQDTIAPAVSKGNETLLNWINDEIKALAAENFFHKDYEETLVDTYGLDYEESLVLEGGGAAE